MPKFGGGITQGEKMKIFLMSLMVVVSMFANDKVLYVYNWSEYLPDEVIKSFTAKTGIKVQYSTYDSNEAMYAKVKTIGASKYDILVPSTYFVNKMAKEGMLEKIDKTKLTNFKNLDKNLVSQSFDPKNEYSVPYLWGSTGISYNTAIIKKPVDSWSNLWDSEFKNNVLLNEEIREVFGIALKILGYSSNSTNPKEIEAAYNKLKELMPNVKMFNSESPKQFFLSDDVSIGMIYNGEAFMANEENDTIKYVYPKEGAILWIDSLVIPKGAKNIDYAHQFINFLLQPEISKKICEEIGYATPNAEAMKLLDDKIKNNRIVYPTKEDLKNSEINIDVGDALQIYEKYWEKLKTNN